MLLSQRLCSRNESPCARLLLEAACNAICDSHKMKSQDHKSLIPRGILLEQMTSGIRPSNFLVDWINQPLQVLIERSMSLPLVQNFAPGSEMLQSRNPRDVFRFFREVLREFQWDVGFHQTSSVEVKKCVFRIYLKS